VRNIPVIKLYRCPIGELIQYVVGIRQHRANVGFHLLTFVTGLSLIMGHDVQCGFQGIHPACRFADCIVKSFWLMEFITVNLYGCFRNVFPLFYIFICYVKLYLVIPWTDENGHCADFH
jgi:hypothetical protein